MAKIPCLAWHVIYPKIFFLARVRNIFTNLPQVCNCRVLGCQDSKESFVALEGEEICSRRLQGSPLQSQQGVLLRRRQPGGTFALHIRQKSWRRRPCQVCQRRCLWWLKPWSRGSRLQAPSIPGGFDDWYGQELVSKKLQVKDVHRLPDAWTGGVVDQTVSIFVVQQLEGGGHI